jgi:hypothetical protein
MPTGSLILCLTTLLVVLSSTPLFSRHGMTTSRELEKLDELHQGGDGMLDCARSVQL